MARRNSPTWSSLENRRQETHIVCPSTREKPQNTLHMANAIDYRRLKLPFGPIHISIGAKTPVMESAIEANLIVQIVT